MQDLGYTNVASMELFEQELALYEEAIVSDSLQLSDYLVPADLIRNALVRIVTAPPGDTYSLMRRLVAHMSDKLDDEYSDVAIRMMAGATKDFRAKQLIMSVLYITRDVLVGDSVSLTDRWIHIVDNNMAIYEFLKNYNHSDQKQVEESYSGNVINSAKTVVNASYADTHVTLPIGYANYDIRLTGEVMQTINFSCSPDIHREADADTSENLTIVSEVILTPNIGIVTISNLVSFYDDAKAQISALGGQYIHGYDTQITLPGLFYSVALSIISTDNGNIWRVSETNILPPSVLRQRN